MRQSDTPDPVAPSVYRSRVRCFDRDTEAVDSGEGVNRGMLLVVSGTPTNAVELNVSSDLW